MAVDCAASAFCLGQDIASCLHILAMSGLILLFRIFLSLGLVAISEFAQNHKTLLRTLGGGEAVGHLRISSTISTNLNLPY